MDEFHERTVGTDFTSLHDVKIGYYVIGNNPLGDCYTIYHFKGGRWTISKKDPTAELGFTVPLRSGTLLQCEEVVKERQINLSKVFLQ